MATSRARDHGPGHERKVELAADDRDVEVRDALAADGQRHRLALGTANPRHDLVDRLVGGLPPVHGKDPVAATELGLGRRRVGDDGVDDRAALVVLTDLDPDADERAAQRLVHRLRLLGREEARVVLVAHRFGQAADRAVRELLVVEVLRVDVVLVDRAPRLLDEVDVLVAGVRRGGCLDGRDAPEEAARVRRRRHPRT